MKQQEKIQAITKILDKLYPKTPIPLKHKDAFTLLVAVLLSGQSTDVSVNKVTPALFKIGGTAEKMSKLSVKQIRDIIKPVGLSPTKSKNIKALSQILVKRFGGFVPDNFEDLESLPGVGHKTASVVMSQAFGHSAFPIDTHIHRLAKRWGLSSGKNVVQTEKDLKRLFPKERWNKLHLQMIFFGREFCPARGHDKKKCPICSLF
ncbi:endonuclease III [Candidatus Peregrinibacteria bacterium]|nr:endonuclease III [Candidatus Peregrinibacteria bacterium]